MWYDDSLRFMTRVTRLNAKRFRRESFTLLASWVCILRAVRIDLRNVSKSTCIPRAVRIGLRNVYKTECINLSSRILHTSRAVLMIKMWAPRFNLALRHYSTGWLFIRNLSTHRDSAIQVPSNRNHVSELVTTRYGHLCFELVTTRWMEL